MKEREISLLELIVAMMLRWRIILVWMAAGAVLAGAFSYMRSDSTARSVQSGDQMSDLGQDLREDPSVFEEQLTDVELQKVNYVLAYESVYQSQLAYKEHSLLMQIDPNCVQETELTFYVEADNARRAADIEKAYEDVVQTDALAAYLEEQIGGKDSAGISELITLMRGSNNIPEGTNTFRVKLIHNDKSVLQDMTESLIDYIQKKREQIVKAMGSHEVILVDQSDAVTVDLSILDAQKRMIDEIAAIETAILQNKEAFTAEQQQYYEFMAMTESDTDEAEDGTKELEQNAPATARISIKYVLLGMFLGAFIYLFVFFMRYVFDHKLSASDSLQELYDIPQLGLIPQQESKKPFAFIDRWILSLNESGGRRFTRAEAMRLSAAAVKMAAAKEETGKICLVGCGLAGQSLEVCETIKEELAKDGIQTKILNNVLYDAQAMCSLEGIDAAVLVERAQSTLYTEIGKEKELLRRQGITILGGIITA